MKHPKTNNGSYPEVKRIIGPCPYCTCTMIHGHLKRMPTRDHIRPRSRFPKNGRTIIVCSECNFMKKNLTLAEFILALRTKNRELRLALEINEDRISNIDYLIRIGIDKE